MTKSEARKQRKVLWGFAHLSRAIAVVGLLQSWPCANCNHPIASHPCTNGCDCCETE